MFGRVGSRGKDQRQAFEEPRRREDEMPKRKTGLIHPVNLNALTQKTGWATPAGFGWLLEAIEELHYDLFNTLLFISFIRA